MNERELHLKITFDYWFALPQLSYRSRKRFQNPAIYTGVVFEEYSWWKMKITQQTR